jgi:hypothetical protein
MAMLRPGRRTRPPIVGGVDVLSPRVAGEVARCIAPNENVHYCLRGDLNHSLVMLDSRLLIVKPGFHAGSTFGALTTSIRYADITGIQIHSFLVAGWIEISSPSFQGRERKRNRHPRTSDRDVYKLPNCIPVKKRRLEDCQPVLHELNERISAAREPHSAAGPPVASARIVNELTRLSDLLERGMITHAEYSIARQSLISIVDEEPPSDARRSAA